MFDLYYHVLVILKLIELFNFVDLMKFGIYREEVIIFKLNLVVQ